MVLSRRRFCWKRCSIPLCMYVCVYIHVYVYISSWRGNESDEFENRDVAVVDSRNEGIFSSFFFFFLDLCTLHFSLKFVENFVTLASWFFCFHLKIMRNVFLVLCLNAFFSWEITREFVFEEINSGPRWNVQIFIVWMKNKDKLLSNYLLYGQKLEKVWN